MYVKIARCQKRYEKEVAKNVKRETSGEEDEKGGDSDVSRIRQVKGRY